MNEKLSDLLFEEYKIVQSKIDKIGEFQLKVRSWSITFETALLAVLLRYFNTNMLYFAMPLIFVIIIIFQYMEQEQKEIETALAKRAFALEKAIDRFTLTRNEREEKRRILDASALRELQGFPRIAVTVRNYSRNRFRYALRHMFGFKTHVFYYCQYALLLIVLLSCLIYAHTNLGCSGYYKKNTIFDTTPVPCMERLGRPDQSPKDNIHEAEGVLQHAR